MRNIRKWPYSSHSREVKSHKWLADLVDSIVNTYNHMVYRWGGAISKAKIPCHLDDSIPSNHTACVELAWTNTDSEKHKV